jgi:DNA polymerase elongation subunit (family B)
LSRDIEDYAIQTRAALAARKLRDAGVPVHPGESVRYVIADAKAKDKSHFYAFKCSVTQTLGKSDKAIKQ